MPTLYSAPCHQKKYDKFDALKYCLEENMNILSSKDTSANSNTPRVSDCANAFNNINFRKISSTSEQSGDKCWRQQT